MRTSAERMTDDDPDAQGGAIATRQERLASGARASRPSSPRWPAPGALLDGTYRVIGVLGEGAMGMVVLAHDERLQRDVAIKLIRPELMEPVHLARFLQEARAMARVRHSNVVEIHAFGELAGAPYFVMEYVAGSDLESFLRQRRGLLSHGEAHSVLLQICRGVEAIHASGAVHRDLKASNVLIGDGFRVAIADLGLARTLEGGCFSDGSLVSGTPAYMAPEIILGQAVSAEQLPLADVYSVGVIAYEVLTGRLPFSGDIPQVLRQQITDPPPPLDRSDLPPGYERAVLDALAKDPAIRTPSAHALRRALETAWAQTHSAAEARLRFLVADDDPGFRGLISATLAKAFPAAMVEGVCDGEAGLEAALTRLPHLVVSDLDMPRLNGVELTAALRSEPRTSRVPIVVATGVGGATDWRVLSALGADGFLVKPFDPAALIALVENLLAMEAAWRPKRQLG